jgi:hypothetical protein
MSLVHQQAELEVLRGNSVPRRTRSPKSKIQPPRYSNSLRTTNSNGFGVDMDLWKLLHTSCGLLDLNVRGKATFAMRRAVPWPHKAVKQVQ